ncbi:PilZ domain-containing protein [Desulfuromonas acetoxidans]|uniref:Type IV pilus assembly PilZ n=1 Tax=Desulfuromonas acetoxidans (strain DSM 684 / 11070) TaxID=281689 RepID=Q1JZP3_DESA6|nr:PilZ domain-containing protein [Desulfuromonas acetoxidans]EAT15849.1 type IV pilus assembly PilZ [Desulfuromonas acetoxidans DSM 684]MBF0644949.1 PilZ domain-containing protein [Desulfuromonas acetoxidans]NVD25606.1 PilZ domain-containing protein [Desulfuromonas acetoxidans]NVE17658.1 PilZ domain-containing protein [Desulfuromonas acetoxidans]
MADFALFKYLEKPSLLRVYILLADDVKVRLEAVARIIAEPYLEIKFRPDELPMDKVRIGGKLLLSLDTRVGTVSMYAHIDEVVNSRVLRVMGLESFAYSQQREYFRVNTAIKVVYSKETLSSNPSPKVPTATVNLSGNGVLISAEEQFTAGDTYELEFHLPDANCLLFCKGLVVRVDEKLRGGYEVAMTYHSIEPEDRDRIISFCLAEQRRLLRTKVQIVGF